MLLKSVVSIQAGWKLHEEFQWFCARWSGTGRCAVFALIPTLPEHVQDVSVTAILDSNTS